MLKRTCKNTLTPIEIDLHEQLEFTLSDGRTSYICLLDTGAILLSTDLVDLHIAENGAKTEYSFSCLLEVDGKVHKLIREIPSAKSFYQPWKLGGLHVWFDAVSDIFEEDGGFLGEKDAGIGIRCKPNKKARFAMQDARLDICPERLHPWCPLPEGSLRIEECYRGEDCWMGPYNGRLAHGGLDINHPQGTPLWAPLDFHDQFLFNSIDSGHNNNRWRGIHRWENGSQWVLQAHHMTKMTVPENAFVPRGTQFASGAGVLSGYADHSHFVFRIIDEGIEYFMDPWILFWKMYNDL